MAANKQKSFRLPPEEWEALGWLVNAGKADNETAALRWLLQQVPDLLDGDVAAPAASAGQLAAKDAHIASLERMLAMADEQNGRMARLLDQAQQLAAMSQQRLGAAGEPKGGKKKRKRK